MLWSHFVIYRSLLVINSLNSSHPLSVRPYLLPSVESGQKQSPFSVHRCGRMGGMLWRSPLGQSQAILKGEHLSKQIVSDRKTAFKWFERRTNWLTDWLSFQAVYTRKMDYCISVTILTEPGTWMIYRFIPAATNSLIVSYLMRDSFLLPDSHQLPNEYWLT